ncbi:MAG: hypothetical protein GKR89_22735 [Candidatus Latescibacteria bacterium]|nr:hypothetical protein [Candidatus Latescibacterota bacterium]
MEKSPGGGVNHPCAEGQIGDYQHDHGGQYWFADPTDKPGALMGLLKILR